MAVKKDQRQGVIKESTGAAPARSKTLTDLDAELVRLKKEQFNLRFQAAASQITNSKRVREMRRDIARVMAMAGEKRAAVRIAAEFDSLRERVQQLEAEQTRLCRALEAEGIATPPQADASVGDEPFALPEPGLAIDAASPRNPRIARVIERLRTASAEEVAARAELADEERLFILRGGGGKG